MMTSGCGGLGGGEAPEQGDTRELTADSRSRTAQTNATLESSYPQQQDI